MSGYKRNHIMSRQRFNNAYTESQNRNKFIVYINEGEKHQIEEWVKIKEDIETGGDLFGLWITSQTAVVQFVLGPGQNCRRSTTSFYQDIEYLRKAGNFLTIQHGLCNIGQWHSHHRLSLSRPSGGDENTVWRNMPNLGLNRYIVFIATIKGFGNNAKVDINPFLFEINQKGNQMPVAPGILKVLNSPKSPFRCNEVILDFIKNGQEDEKQNGKNADEMSTKKKPFTSTLEKWLKNEKVQIKLFPNIKDSPNGNEELENKSTQSNTFDFKVHIYEDELYNIRRWVLQKEHIETGGDLFGLWMDKRNVVVQFVLGPGLNCRRTTTSFFQDTEYLAKVGNFITKNHGLCNVGQWHSHHRLNLPRPSTGDETTVWSNMPGLGIERYVVFIATIKDESTVKVNCFLFEIDNETKTQLPVLEGEICEIKREYQHCSPVRKCGDLTTVVQSGMEDDPSNCRSVVLDVE